MKLYSASRWKIVEVRTLLRYLIGGFLLAPSITSAAETLWRAYDVDRCEKWFMSPDAIIMDGPDYESAQELEEELSAENNDRWFIVGAVKFDGSQYKYGVCKESQGILFCRGGPDFPMSGARFKAINNDTYQCIGECENLPFQIFTDERSSKNEDLFKAYDNVCHETADRHRKWYESIKGARPIEDVLVGQSANWEKTDGCKWVDYLSKVSKERIHNSAINGVHLLFCKADEPEDNHYRLWIVLRGQEVVGDEVVIPDPKEVHPTLYKTGNVSCEATDRRNKPTEFGPFLFRAATSQSILIAYRVDIQDISINVIPTSRISCPQLTQPN